MAVGLESCGSCEGYGRCSLGEEHLSVTPVRTMPLPWVRACVSAVAMTLVALCFGCRGGSDAPVYICTCEVEGPDQVRAVGSSAQLGPPDEGRMWAASGGRLVAVRDLHVTARNARAGAVSGLRRRLGGQPRFDYEIVDVSCVSFVPPPPRRHEVEYFDDTGVSMEPTALEGIELVEVEPPPIEPRTTTPRVAP